MEEFIPPEAASIEIKGNPTEDERDAVIAALVVYMGASAAAHAQQEESKANESLWSAQSRQRIEQRVRAYGQQFNFFRRRR